MDQQSSIPRPSGLPRPASRLPVLRPSGSQSQLRPPSSTEQLRRKPSVPTLSRPSQPSTLQKKSSRASLVRSNTPSTTPSAASSSSRASAVTTNRRVSGIPSFGPALTSTVTNDAPVFKRPYARPPSRQTKIPPQLAASGSSREDDALGSLDGFRSASRASSRAGSRVEFHEDNVETDPALEQVAEPEKAAKKKSRPSLSERTIESLSQLPSSPAAGGGKGRRRSSFFNVDNSMPPPLRPASAMSSNHSRPTTSDGTARAPPATPKRFGTASGKLSMTAPSRRSISASVTTPSKVAPVGRPASTIKKQPLTVTQNLQNAPKPRPVATSKSMVARTPKPRGSLSGLFGQAISPPGVTAAAPVTPSPSREALARKTPSTNRKVSSSSIALREQIAKAKAGRKSGAADEPEEPSPKAASSSNALREQIAKAKEAARRAKLEPERTNTPPRDVIVPDPAEIAGFDFGLDDPFNQGTKGSKSLLRRRIDSARAEGRLNIAAMGLKVVPGEVLTMYQYDANDSTVAWGDVVDITSFLAADNELQTLPDSMFPDISVEETIDSDEGGPQFGAIQNFDLHGNVLLDLPLGLTRLTQLSKLNLSRNKLSTNVFKVISGITSLRELKLAENDLQGSLPASIANLTALEVIDLQNNKLTSLPTEVRLLTSLRVLDVSNNQLSRIPSELFETSLVEFRAIKNKLEGSLFTIDSIPHLQELHVSNNGLTNLSDGDNVNMPALRTLNISTNRLAVLPNMETWVQLHTLLVAENKLTALPESLFELPLRTLDLTANDLAHLDERLALMPLERLNIAANPLRERKFLTMALDGIKRTLSARMAPPDDAKADEDEADHVVNREALSQSGWIVSPSGLLDLSSKDLSHDLSETDLLPIADQIRHLNLASNKFATIPATISIITHLTVLDLSKNNIITALTSPLSLPRLRDLRLTSNALSSLDPLTTHLSAPLLQTLDISNNRLTASLPVLRQSFPELISLIACDNRISSVSAESLTGLKIINLSNNDIERLEPRIGLQVGVLTALNVEGNKFRVPSYHVLQKGTDAVLAWLRDKIPRERERESWRSDGTGGTDGTDGTVEFYDAVDGGVD